MSLTAMFQSEAGLAMVVALALGVLLLALRPRDRASTRNAMILLGACAILQVGGLALSDTRAGRVAGAVADVGTVLTGLVLLRLAAILLFRVALPAAGMVTARIVEDLAVTALFAAWGLVWLRLSGVDLASLVTTSAVVTAVVAFSMQETLGNVLGGVVLQLDDSIRVGDWIRLDEASHGRVIQIRWRSTQVETRNAEILVIPNSWLMKNRFTVVGSNRASTAAWRRWVRVPVDFASSPREVCAVLERAVTDARIEHVAADPAPNAVLMEIFPKYGLYALRYWLTDPRPDDATDSRVRAHLLAALARSSMKLGAPYSEELLVKDNEAHRQAQTAAEMARRRAVLARVDLFAQLSEAEREKLAEHLAHAPFVAGDTITRQGAIAHWLYLISRGLADVWIGDGADRRKVATLEAGSVFGEMGMMTGSPRRATVTAQTDIDCYRLDKAGFEEILRARPDIADEVSRTLASRTTSLVSVAESGGSRAGAEAHADIRSRIREFFGLSGSVSGQG